MMGLRATATSGGLALLGAIAACAAAGSPDPTGPSAATRASWQRTSPSTCDGVPPTYAQDILPILRRRCFQCHAGDGAAAEDHNFSRFATFYAQRRTVADQIAACTMPPPSQPTIPTDEADAILRWVACGGIER
jgi:hypothetical protein